jgi:hypothetical protein
MLIQRSRETSYPESIIILGDNSQKIITSELVGGDGKLLIGLTEHNGVYGISFREIEEKKYEIGKEVDLEEFEKKYRHGDVTLWFKNEDSLNVLADAVEKLRSKIKEERDAE